MAVTDIAIQLTEGQNFFAHIYTTHAHKTIQDYISRDKKERIRRAKIEADIIRLTHENPDLPLFHKVVCSSMIMHTDTFESFWFEQKRAYHLPDKSLQRLEPQYSLIEGISCPQTTDSSSSSVSDISSPEYFKNGKKKRGPAKKEKKPKKKSNQPLQPIKKNARVAKKATSASKPRPAPAVRGQGRQTQAKSKPKAIVTLITKPRDETKSALVKEEEEVTTESATRRPLSAREAFQACMARREDDLHLRGPTSDEEETEDDDGDTDTE